MIPKIIWQTYKTSYEDLPWYAKDSSSSWIRNNPEYEYRYMSDEEAASFILSYYGQDYYDLFMQCPIGVMRGDMWRYLVIYKFGGVYADIDTRCNVKIDDWLNEDADVFISLEDNVHFCQWAFAAKPGSPLIKQVIDLMIDRLKNLDTSYPHFVHRSTGPGVWTEGILSYIQDVMSHDLYNRAREYESRIRENDVNIYIDSTDMFLNSVVTHLFGSVSWNDGNYARWQKGE